MALLDKFHQRVSTMNTQIPKDIDPQSLKGGLIWVDGEFSQIKKLKQPVVGDLAFAVNVSSTEFEILCQFVDVKALKFKGLRAVDLSPLSELPRLTELCLWWCPKVRDLQPLSALSSLTLLCLDDIKWCNDLSVLGELRNLNAFSVSGGLWKPQRIKTLTPIGELPKIRDVSVTNVKVGNDGLRPLANCRNLRGLRLSNQFPTEDFAFLSAKLPEVDCSLFRPYTVGNPSLGEKSVMITGYRKPFLDPLRQKDRIQKYASDFAKLQRKFGMGTETQ